MKIAVFVKAKRKNLGLTQIILAQRAGVGLRFVRDLEQEKPTLRLDKVNQVLDLFGSGLGIKKPMCSPHIDLRLKTT